MDTKEPATKKPQVKRKKRKAETEPAVQGEDKKTDHEETKPETNTHRDSRKRHKKSDLTVVPKEIKDNLPSEEEIHVRTIECENKKVHTNGKQEESEEIKDNLLAFYSIDHDNEALFPCGKVAVTVAYTEEDAREILDDRLSDLRLKTSKEKWYDLIPIPRFGEPRAEIFDQTSSERAKMAMNGTKSRKTTLNVFACENHNCGDGMSLVSSYALILALDETHAVTVMDAFLNGKGWKTSKTDPYSVISFTSLKRPKAHVLNSQIRYKK